MALVNLLRFDENMGAIISDEEWWNIQFRKRTYCDNLHSLLDEEQSDAWKMEVTYGAVGYPAVHHEVVRDVRALLAERIRSAGKARIAPPATVHDVTRIAFECLQQAVRRRIDQKLKFFYGFDTNDLTRGYIEDNGQKCEIKNTKVVEAARTMAAGDKPDPLLKAAIDCRAAVFGHDPLYGITAYYLSPERSICGYVHEGFDCLGSGKYASGLSLGQSLNARTMMMRRQGYTPAEGLLELVMSALIAKNFREVGGNMNLVIIDGSRRTHGERYREVFDDRARLATEIGIAFQSKQLPRKDAVSMLNDLVFADRPVAQVEEKLFNSVADRRAFCYILRRYKTDEVPSLVTPQAEPARHGGELRASGGGPGVSPVPGDGGLSPSPSKRKSTPRRAKKGGRK
jgi:hypothetical protein